MRILRFLKLSKGDGAPAVHTGFDPTTTKHFQVKMRRAPAWFCSFLAGNSREKSRLKREMATMKGSVAWLVQQ